MAAPSRHKSVSNTAHSQGNYARALLQRANSPATATDVLEHKIQNKRMALLPTASKRFKQEDLLLDPTARSQRQQRRAKIDEAKHKKARNKPRPLSAKEKRQKGVYDLHPGEIQYATYLGLNKMWCAYMRDVLGIGENQQNVHVASQNAGSLLASADYHGAEFKVVQSRCTGRVGLQGIVLRETMFTFVLVTTSNKVVTVPKEGTVFRFDVPIAESPTKQENVTTERSAEVTIQAEAEKTTPHIPEGQSTDEHVCDRKPLIFEIQGESFKSRPTHRATKKWRWHKEDVLL